MRRFSAGLAAISLAGLGLRVLWILAGDWSPSRLIGDAGFYHEVALLVAKGEGFSAPGMPGTPTAIHPPLHPLLLALPSALGLTSWTAHRLFGALVGTVTVALVGLLGRRVAGDRAGLVAAALAATYPIFVRIDGSAMSETLYGALIAGCLLTAYRLLERPSAVAAAGMGGLIGAATLTRAEAILLLPLLAGPLLLRARRRRLLSLGVACLACAVVLAPWTVRNWSAFDRFVPVSTNNGTALAGANCARTYFGLDIGFWRFECLDLKRRPLKSEVDQAQRLRDKGLGYARDHPTRLPLVIPARILRTFDLYQPWRQATFSEGGHVALYRIGVVAFFGLAVLGIWGTVLLRRRRQPLFVLMAPFVLVTLTAALTLGAARLRYAAEVPLLVLAAVAITRAAERVRA